MKGLYDSVSERLEHFDKFKGEVGAMKEYAIVAKDAIEAKSVEVVELREEKESMKKLINKMTEELDNVIIEVFNIGMTV